MIQSNKKNNHHFQQILLHTDVIRFLEDGLEKEGVLGEPLHWPHQDVDQPEPVAVPLSLAPLQQCSAVSQTYRRKPTAR